MMRTSFQLEGLNVTVIFCGVPVWCCFASAETVWTVETCTLLGYHYVASLDLGQELSGDN